MYDIVRKDVELHIADLEKKIQIEQNSVTSTQDYLKRSIVELDHLYATLEEYKQLLVTINK
jgi:hypothetical protein